MITPVTGKNPKLWIFSKIVVIPKPRSPKGAGLANLFSIFFSFLIVRKVEYNVIVRYQLIRNWQFMIENIHLAKTDFKRPNPVQKWFSVIQCLGLSPKVCCNGLDP